MRASLLIFIFGVFFLQITSAKPQSDFVFDYADDEMSSGPNKATSNRLNKPVNNRRNNDYYDGFGTDYNTGDDYGSFIPNQPNRPNSNRPGFNNNNRPNTPVTNRPTRPPMVIRPSTPPAPVPTRPSPCETSCLTTGQYNPVCGSDNITYNNIGRLECAQRCGKNIKVRRPGRCQGL